MTTWCLAHPWLTFFLTLAAINGAVVIVRGWKPEYCDGEGD